MENKLQVREFVKQLEKRTLEFAVRIIRLSSMLPNTAEGKVVKTQLTKCGTSIGANYREANAAFWRGTVIPLVRKAAGAMTRRRRAHALAIAVGARHSRS